jgi:preprotein translocase subunit SecD
VAQATRQRPGRALLGIFIVIVAMYLGVFLGPSPTPALGLDLRGGTQVTLRAQPLANSGSVTKGDLDTAVNIIRDRVNGLGVGGAEINTQGSRDIVVSVPGKGRQQVVNTVGETALLRFRQVMEVGTYAPTPKPTTSPTPSVSPSPSSSATPKPSVTKRAGKRSKHSSSQGDVLNPALLVPAAKHTTAPKRHSGSTPTPTSATTPAASPAPTNPSLQPQGNTTQPLPHSESPTLSAAFLKAFQNWDCAKHPNPTNGNDLASDYIISCDSPRTVKANGEAASKKYLLAPAAIEGTDVKSASAGLDPQGVNWVVNVTFKSSGPWLALTKKTYEVTNSGDPGYATGCAPPKGCNAIGITLDGVVESDPATLQDGIPGGQTQISGNFSQSDASDLATVLKYGSLPLKFSIPTSQSVSATLGAAQLRGGLIAGAIGLGLVILFSLLYYRALGLVTVGSLAVSGLILYAVTTLLGHSSVGYTLSLPGIAGFIVAVGITADSFVVYFERLRDEIREGRRLRSAVDRAWPRARRTILSADTVSLLAAIVLYIVSIGDVRGFAFTLGMSTLSDLFIVFFFTRPLLQLLGRRKGFDSGAAWTGIGRTRAGVTRDVDPEGPSRRRPTRTREA